MNTKNKVGFNNTEFLVIHVESVLYFRKKKCSADAQTNKYNLTENSK